MSKKILCIVSIVLIFVSGCGCSNVKFLGKKLNKEEQKTNEPHIEYLKSN